MEEENISSKGFQYPIVFLPCHNLKSVYSFYYDILRIPLALDQGICLIFRIGKANKLQGYWGFCANSNRIINPEKVCLTLVVSTRDEVDQWHKKLIKLGTPCIKKPSYTQQFHIYNTFFKDPTGYTLEIQVFDIEYAPK